MFHKRTHSRSLALALALVLALMLVLAACAPGETATDAPPAPTDATTPGQTQTDPSAEAPPTDEAPPEPVDLVFWTLWDGGDVEIAQAIFDEYNSTHEYVNIEVQSQAWNEYQPKLKTGMLGGEGPDFAIAHLGGFVTGLQADGMLVPISAEAARLGVDIDFGGYTASAMEAAKVDGDYYAVPCDNLVRTLMYNKDIIRDLGMLDANDNLILEPGYGNFKAMLQKVKDEKPEVQPLVITMRPPQLVLAWLTLYVQYGGSQFIDLEAQQAVFDDAIAVKALETYRDMYANFVPENLTDPAGLEMFSAGEAAFYIDGAWNVSTAANAVGDGFGVVPFPQLGEKNAHITTNHAFIIPVNNTLTDAKTKAILEFIKWWGENNWKWSQAGHLPAYMPAVESAEFNALPWPKTYKSLLDIAVPIYIIPNANLHQTPATTDPIQAGILGSISVEDAVKQVKDNLNALIPELLLS